MDPERWAESRGGCVITRFGFGLSRELWLVQIGVFLNTLGWGAVLPFEFIYLHNGRGFSLSIAGLVVGTLTGVAVLAAPLAGVLIDRFGTRACAAGAGVALAAGYGGRVVMMALGAWLIAAACLVVASATVASSGAYLACHTSALMPLVADLAPPSLRGRYMATMGLSWWVGLALAPTRGTQLLSVSGALTFVACAAVAGGAAVAMLTLEHRLPAASRFTPRPTPIARLATGVRLTDAELPPLDEPEHG